MEAEAFAGNWDGFDRVMPESGILGMEAFGNLTVGFGDLGLDSW